MKKKIFDNWPNYYLYYILMLVFFGVFSLYYKHDVGNDSTISDWLINYSGGFVRRGLIGQLTIEFSNFLSLELRKTILIFQTFFFTTYYLLVFFSFKKNNKKSTYNFINIYTNFYIISCCRNRSFRQKRNINFSYYCYLFFNRRSKI